VDAAPTGEVPADALPVWLTRSARSDLAQPAMVTPSRSLDAEPVAANSGANDGDRTKAMRRGTLVHRLLQALPDIAPDQRAEAIRGYLARAARAFSAAEQEQIAGQIDTVLTDSRFAALFAPGSRAEVPIAGRLRRDGRIVTVAGQVDRLVVTGNSVLIADYKTNHPAPRRLEDAQGYVRQLALYRAVLAKLYPGHDIRAALLWTSVPDLMPVPAQALDAELARFTPA
jgi:ATP-dependent helicase/nuclease subunit A